MKHIKAKVKKFNKVVNTVFSENEIRKDSIHYICLAATYIDSVMTLDKKAILSFT